ncbi:hypothetical protein [Falsiroseomonas tokyonensis]|uniref:Uncharacterized protein n=1 Tax=Falsiroseomonas tokyonensis TaxID=430521 RepID=A0ABV7BX30_9PROT|nr:hypothetical protein [Falsiroseomonas tokyonensis]MBU8538740.1 hypothetical protein [Falsiroseomonas tokyonensis]
MTNIVPMMRPKPISFDPLQLGKEAWDRIKTGAKTMREDWRLVGIALKIGRDLHPSNQAFGQWCRDNGFGGMSRHERADALWMVANPDAVVWATHNTPALNHPTEIRRAHNAYLAGEREADEAEAPPAPETPAPKPSKDDSPWDGPDELAAPRARLKIKLVTKPDGRLPNLRRSGEMRGSEAGT